MRTFSEGFNAILSGGACYWMAIIRPNASDTFTPMVFGTIPTTTMAGYDIKAGRLVNITDIDQSIDIYKETFAKTPSVSISFYNTDGIVEQNNLVGRQVEIRMGYGSTMSIATSEVFFTGKIKVIDKNDLNKVTLDCVGTLKDIDGEIGKIAADTYDRDVGKIYPIINGDWSDNNAYCPILVGAWNKNCLIYIYGEDNIAGLTSAIYLYSKNNKNGYLFDMRPSNRVFLGVDNKFVLLLVSYTLYANIAQNNNGTIVQIETSTDVYDLIDVANKQYFIVIGNDTYGIMGTLALPTGKRYLDIVPINSQSSAHLAGEGVYIIENDGEISSFARVQIRLDINGAKNIIRSTYKTSQYNNFIFGNKENALELYSFLNHEISIQFNPVCDIPEIESLTAIECKVLATGLMEGLTIQSRSEGSIAKIATLYNSETKESTATYVVPGDQNQSFDLSITVFTGITEVDIKSMLSQLGITVYTKSKNWIPGTPATEITTKFEDLYLTIIAQVNLNKTIAWARNTGRRCPNEEYFNDTISTLMTNPSSIIEDFCRNSVPSMSYLNLDQTSFDNYYTDRADWKLATAIYTGMK